MNEFLPHHNCEHPLKTEHRNMGQKLIRLRRSETRARTPGSPISALGPGGGLPGPPEVKANPTCVVCAYATLAAGVKWVLNDVKIFTRYFLAEFCTRTFVPGILYPKFCTQTFVPKGVCRCGFGRVEFCTLACGFRVEFCTLLLAHKTRRWRV